MNAGVLRAIAQRIFVHNFYLKFIAAVLTLALYIWVSEDRETVVAGFAGVRIVVPENMVLVSDPVDRVKVTIRGRWSDIARFNPEQLDAIRIDLTRADRDSIIQISHNMVRVPPGLRVVSIEPNSMYVQLEPQMQKTVPIVPTFGGDLDDAYVVEDVTITPSEVVATGPENRIQTLVAAPTQVISMSDRVESFRQGVDLRREDRLIDFEISEPIIVDVQIRAEEKETTLEDIPVVAVNTTYSTEITPPTINVTLRGSRSRLDNLSLDILRAEIDLTAEDDRPPGTFSKNVEIRNLPPDVELVRTYPRSFQVRTMASQ